MIRVIKASSLFKRPLLAAAMFRDRAGQFIGRHGWDLTVDEQGLEFDQYDDLDPTYVILEDAYGDHLASARVMPTTGRTMLNEHFQDVIGGSPIGAENIWEVTRFCASPRIETLEGVSRLSVCLMWALSELAQRNGVDAYVGCCAVPFVRLMKTAGIATAVLGERGSTGAKILGCRWDVTHENIEKLQNNVMKFNRPSETDRNIFEFDAIFIPSYFHDNKINIQMI